MDLSEEVRAAHKREFSDFLDQDVCPKHSVFSSPFFFFTFSFFISNDFVRVKSLGWKGHIHGRNQNPNQPQAPPPYRQHLRSPQLPRLG